MRHLWTAGRKQANFTIPTQIGVEVSMPLELRVSVAVGEYMSTCESNLKLTRSPAPGVGRHVSV
jgi:hypothetical protein